MFCHQSGPLAADRTSLMHWCLAQVLTHTQRDALEAVRNGALWCALRL